LNQYHLEAWFKYRFLGFTLNLWLTRCGTRPENLPQTSASGDAAAADSGIKVWMKVSLTEGGTPGETHPLFKTRFLVLFKFGYFTHHKFLH
jgi:hypothetical protein